MDTNLLWFCKEIETVHTHTYICVYVERFFFKIGIGITCEAEGSYSQLSAKWKSGKPVSGVSLFCFVLFFLF